MNKNAPFYIVTLAIFAMLKLWFASSNTENLYFILSPTNKIVELLTSIDSAYEINKGYYYKSLNVLIKKERGKFRKAKVGVRSEGRLIYLAIEPEFVKQELQKLFADIAILLKAKLSYTEIFYYAAYLHLVFVNIHPFIDGNGRTTRLLEKWFLAKMLGETAWLITSEKNYWDNRNLYYKNLQIGVNYYEIKYEKSIPFLLMLPNSL